MKRTHIMIAVFFACILSPNLLFPILKTTADEGTGENRSLAAFPTLSLETIDTFPSGVEDWINDHAAFRNRFLSLNARLNLSLFQFGDSHPFLYNLATDIHEDNNVADQHPEIVEKMKAVIFTQHTPNPNFSVTLPEKK